MITAIVHIDTEADSIPEAATQIAEIPAVHEVFSVTGDTDLIAMVRVRQHDELADVIASRISKVTGVRATRTYIAFKTYSNSDLESAFSLGLGD